MRFILGLLIGIGIGAAIGTLRAPQSREALQQRVRDITGEHETSTPVEEPTTI